MACTQAALQAAISTANGNGATVNRQSGTFRNLTVNGGNLTLRTATLSNGDAGGSAIAPGAGGGIVVTGNGVLTVNSSTIRNNQANFGGGLSVFNGSQANVGTTTVQANAANQNGGGIHNNVGTVTLLATRFSSNISNNCLTSPSPVPGCTG
ncbi:hypothetical protein [Streptomyces sp. NBC_00096]|uniref:hypothetical protein n=1 Tax=Streptomyces sp. NBC_00096 TaxID=2975650 RepID=UPI0032485EC4